MSRKDKAEPGERVRAMNVPLAPSAEQKVRLLSATTGTPIREILRRLGALVDGPLVEVARQLSREATERHQDAITALGVAPAEAGA